jgi:hypothetical protein
MKVWAAIWAGEQSFREALTNKNFSAILAEGEELGSNLLRSAAVAGGPIRCLDDKPTRNRLCWLGTPKIIAE